MNISISDLAFMGFKAKALKELPKEYAFEFFYEFGKNSYWDLIIPELLEGRAKPSIHAPCVSVNLADESTTEWLSILRKTFVYASKCEAQFVVVHTNEAWSGDKEEIQECVEERLKMIAKIASDYNIQLLIENVGLKTNETLLYDWKEYKNLIKKIPGAKALIDVGHAHINEWDIPNCIETLGEDLVAIHLHDNNGRIDSHQAIGEGNIKWKPIFQSIKKNNPSVCLVLEYSNITMPDLLAHIEIIKTKYLENIS